MHPVVVRILAIAGALLVLSAFAAPAFIGTNPGKGEVEGLWLVPAVPQLAAAGGGPYTGEARLAATAVALFGFILVLDAVLLLLLGLRRRPGLVRLTNAVAVLTLVACAGAALLVLALAGHFETVFPLSPAFALATVGAVLGLVAARASRSAAATVPHPVSRADPS